MSSNWSIGFVGNSVELLGKVLGGAGSSEVKKPGLEFKIVATVDFNVGVPGVVLFSGPFATAATVADGIAADLQWSMPDIVN